ncbi:MAG: hypothetical protein WBA93_28755 [Microcoleaceae cyanobacterium]
MICDNDFGVLSFLSVKVYFFLYRLKGNLMSCLTPDMVNKNQNVYLATLEGEKLP